MNEKIYVLAASIQLLQVLALISYGLTLMEWNKDYLVYGILVIIMAVLNLIIINIISERSNKNNE